MKGNGFSRFGKERKWAEISIHIGTNRTRKALLWLVLMIMIMIMMMGGKNGSLGFVYLHQSAWLVWIVTKWRFVPAWLLKMLMRENIKRVKRRRARVWERECVCVSEVRVSEWNQTNANDDRTDNVFFFKFSGIKIFSMYVCVVTLWW